MSQSYPQSGGRGALSSGCASGNCRAFGDVVSRPSLYSTQINNSSTFAAAAAATAATGGTNARIACRCGPTCVCGCQKGRSCRCTQQQQQQQQHYRPPGTAAALTAPQPPHVNKATAAFGYGPPVEIPTGRQVPQKQHHFPPTRHTHPNHCQPHHHHQQQQQQPHGFNCCNEQTQRYEQPAVITVVGKLVCLTCFAQSVLSSQKSAECTENCLREGNPAAVLEQGSNRTIALLAAAPRFAPLHNKTVRVTGIVAGPLVVNNGAIFVQTLQMLQNVASAVGGSTWVDFKM